jgi:hypothetical protein
MPGSRRKAIWASVSFDKSSPAPYLSINRSEFSDILTRFKNMKKYKKLMNRLLV